MPTPCAPQADGSGKGVKRLTRRGAVFLLLAVLALVSPALAADIRLGLAVEPDSIDPHYHNFGGNKSLMQNLFDALTSIDAQDRLGPGLAVAWTLVDDTTWEFRLRDGVTLSDGTPFTADNVAFTNGRAPNVPTTVTAMSEYVKPIARVEVVHRLTVRLHTKGQFPLTPEYLSAIGIVSRRHDEGASTADYNSGNAALSSFISIVPARGLRVVCSTRIQVLLIPPHL